MRIQNITKAPGRGGNLYTAEVYTQKGRSVGSWRPALIWHCWGRAWWPQGADMGSWALGRVGEPQGTDMGSWVVGRVGDPQEAGQEHSGLLVTSGTWQSPSACTAFNNEWNRTFNMQILIGVKVGNRHWTLQNICYCRSSSLCKKTGLSAKVGFSSIAGRLNSVVYKSTWHLSYNNRL